MGTTKGSEEAIREGLLALAIQERPHPCPKSTTGRGKEAALSLAPCPLSGPQFPLLLEVSLPS